MKPKTHQPFFSIIIPTLNEELFLPTLLTSLSQQNFKDFEIIVVDGKSEDKTVKVAQYFNKKLPKLTILKSLKRHVSVQRNLGAKNAKGKYLIFFDADSNIEKLFLKHLRQILKKSSFGVFSSKIKFSSNLIDNLLVLSGNLFLKISEFIKKPMPSGAFIGCKKSVFLQTQGFSESLKMSEDHDFAWRCVKNNFKFKLLNKPKFSISFRRFHHQGYLKTLKQWTFDFVGSLKKKYTEPKFKYEMGGKIYQKKQIRPC